MRSRRFELENLSHITVQTSRTCTNDFIILYYIILLCKKAFAKEMKQI